jgi:hypothetical protein
LFYDGNLWPGKAWWPFGIRARFSFVMQIDAQSIQLSDMDGFYSNQVQSYYPTAGYRNVHSCTCTCWINGHCLCSRRPIQHSHDLSSQDASTFDKIPKAEARSYSCKAAESRGEEEGSTISMSYLSTTSWQRSSNFHNHNPNTVQYLQEKPP